MIVDPSAIVALITQDPVAAAVSRSIAEADTLLMSAGSWVELGAVQDRWMSRVQREETNAFLDRVEMSFVPLSVQQARLARLAHRRYGAGSGSPARLSMGECFSYALAIELDEPLLFVGDGFRHTDVRAVRLP